MHTNRIIDPLRRVPSPEPRTNYVRVSLPRHLDLFGARDELCRSLNELAHYALVERRPALIGFEAVSSVKPSGLLSLAAVAQTARELLGRSAVTGTYPTDRKIERVLQEAGFFELLGVPARSKLTAPRIPQWVEHITHNQSDGATVERLKERVFGCGVDINESALSLIYVGLTEAMTNVVQHAYDLLGATPRLAFVERRWWITGNIDRARRTFTFSICDLGIGIPKSIGRKVPDHDLQKFLQYDSKSKINDADLLKIALMVGESSTDLPWRGRGMPQMREVVDSIGGGIRICSGLASAQYSRAGITSQAHDVPHVGTVVEWAVPLDQVLQRKDL